MKYLKLFEELNNQNCIIIHGMPTKKEYLNGNKSMSNQHWIPWIQNQLNISNIITQTPEFPIPYNPIYKDWEKVLDNFKIDGNTILICHSFGCGFILKYLNKNKIKFNKIYLIAPYLDINNELKDNYYNFKNIEGEFCLYYSTDDDKEILESVELIKDKIKNIIVNKFNNRGHFTSNKFTDLLSDII